MAARGIREDGLDLALAIWQIDPAATYLADETQTQILEWRGPGEQPTEAELQAAWAAYHDPATRRVEPHVAAREANLATIRQAAADDPRFAALARHLGIDLGDG